MLSLPCSSPPQLASLLTDGKQSRVVVVVVRYLLYHIQSPTGLVSKSNGDTRLIFHLSYPEIGSVNYHTPKEICSVKYKDLDHAIILCMEAGESCYLAKADIKSAFRHLPIRREDWCWLVMMAVDPVTVRKKYFYDKCIPFGSSISCANFQ